MLISDYAARGYDDHQIWRRLKVIGYIKMLVEATGAPGIVLLTGEWFMFADLTAVQFESWTDDELHWLAEGLECCSQVQMDEEGVPCGSYRAMPH